MGDLTNDLSLQDVLVDSTELERTLAIGAEGHDVARVQAALRRLDLPAGTIDGIFGDKTAAALQSFAVRAGLMFTGVVDDPLWAALTRAVADHHARALAAQATAFEQLAAAHHAAATVAQQVARDKRTQALPAGDDEERAGDALLQAGQTWLDAAGVWLAAAERMQAGHQGYARHLGALEQGRSHGTRAANAFALAGKDFTAEGATGHELRLATSIVAARTIAAR